MGSQASAKNLPNHAGLCDRCKAWADEISGGDMIIQRRIGLFADRYLHRATHFELHTIWMHKREYWPDLMRWLGIGVSEA